MIPRKEVETGFFLGRLGRIALARASCWSRRLAGLCFVLCLTSCGVIYKSPTITASANGDTDVRIVDITGASLSQANQSEFRPRTLPVVFSTSAGTGTGPRGGQTLPEGAIDEQIRPARPEMRLPPPRNPALMRLE